MFFVIFFVILFGLTSVRMLQPNERGIVIRLGKYRRTVGSGITFIIPFFESIKKVDIREQVVDIEPQEVITKDNVVVTVDAIVYYEVTDPFKLYYSIANFKLAVTRLAQTSLRNMIGEMDLDQTLVSREIINKKLRQTLDDATEKWGVKVTRVEIKRIDPPSDVMQAMHRQMKAERDKRAMILEAEGKKQSAILEAEGQREAAIKKAEGEAEAIRKVADARKYEKIAIAEGEGEAIIKVFSAIHQGKPTKDLITLKYLDSLSTIAQGQATKIFLPFEATGILGGLAGIREIFTEERKKEEVK
jgi:regulator of protease activity HflC (stomatin/prohibitin superfamily)